MSCVVVVQVRAAAEAQSEHTFQPALNNTSRRLAAAGQVERAAQGGVQRGRTHHGKACVSDMGDVIHPPVQVSIELNFGYMGHAAGIMYGPIPYAASPQVQCLHTILKI